MTVKPLVAFLTVFIVVGLSRSPDGHAQGTVTLDAQTKALEMINNFADRFCTNIPLVEEKNQLKLSGGAKVELNELINMIADPKLEADAEYVRGKYQGVLQKDLVEALKNSVNCRLEIWKDLRKLVPQASPEGTEALQNQSIPIVTTNSLQNLQLKWSSVGPIPDLKCTQIHEGRDPHSWHDNYLCSNYNIGLRWSSVGPIAGLTCTKIHESRESPEHSWHDNYLCVPENSSIRFRWSSVGPIAGLTCTKIHESREPPEHTWHDNYLCYE